MKKILPILFCVLTVAGIFLYVFMAKAGKPTIIKEQAQKSQSILPIIVPHFDAFAKERKDFLSTLSHDIEPEKIIVMSVDHYNSGKTDISATAKDWQTRDKTIPLSKALLAQFSSVAGVDDNAFTDEHGIKNVLPEIAATFPKASILPIIIKDKASKEKIDNLSDALKANCSNNCLLVGSVDFSHNNPNSLAKLHDEYSISALSNLDEAKAKLAETDSPNILSILTEFAKAKEAQGFKLNFNSNSSEKMKDDSVESTSVVIGQFTIDKSLREKSTTMIFAGDMMLDRMVYHNFKSDLTKIFDKFGPRVFWGTDGAILNNEGPISDEPITDDISAGNLTFNFPKETTGVLSYLHVNAVSLANNHSMNAGKDGFGVTEQLLREAGIKYFGNQNNFDEDSIMNIDGEIPISIFGVNLLSVSNLDPIKAAVRSAKDKGRFVIIFPHWGNEYQNTHSSSQRSSAQEFISSGADAIIGSHPHVVQDFEIIDGKPVVYSLGNFVFDQTFSKPTQQGLIVGLSIKEKSVEMSFLPTHQVSLKPQFMRYGEKSAKIGSILDIDSLIEFSKVRSDTIKIERNTTQN